MKQRVSEAYPEPCQTSKVEFFSENSWNRLTIFEKSLILYIRQCSEYASEFSCKRSLGWRETDILNTHKSLTENQSNTKWHRCGRCGAMSKHVECLCCHEDETVQYFELLGMRYSDMNAVIRRA